MRTTKPHVYLRVHTTSPSPSTSTSTLTARSLTASHHAPRHTTLIPTASARIQTGNESPVVQGTRYINRQRDTLRIEGGVQNRIKSRVQTVTGIATQTRNLSFGGIDERRSQSTHHTLMMAHQTLPADLPIPQDDGACSHLPNAPIPSISLPIARSHSSKIDLSTLPGLIIVFFYPRTGAPNETVPDSWNAIPGARGCTPQACSFRDAFSEITKLGVAGVFGMSTQSPAYHAEVHQRLHLPYDLLSDEELRLQKALKLPTFDWEGGKVFRRMTVAIEGGMVVKVWYPVFPPDKATDEVVSWLKERTEAVREPPAGILTSDHVA